MLSPSAVGKEICVMGEPSFVNEEAEGEAKEDDVHHLTAGKPFFDVILAATHLNPRYTMYIPSSFQSALPRAIVPVVLRHGGKKWNLSYFGGVKRPHFGGNWKTFVSENHLKIGDACVFELMDSSSMNLTFKVHILRGDLPPELLMAVDSRGKTPKTEITLD